MLGPGTPIFAKDDSSVAQRAPSLYRVVSTYTQNAQDAAEQGQTMITAITAAIAVGVIWMLSRGRK